MPYRLQIDSNKNGIARPEDVELFEWDIVVDPITDGDTNGPMRRIKIPRAARQRICDAINLELSGDDKRAQRIADARAERAAQQATTP